MRKGAYYRLEGFRNDRWDYPDAWVIVKVVADKDRVLRRKIRVIDVCERYRDAIGGWTVGRSYTFDKCWKEKRIAKKEEILLLEV